MICRCKRTRKRTNNKFQQRKWPGPFWSTSALASARVPFCCYLQMHTRMREVKEGFHVISMQRETAPLRCPYTQTLWYIQACWKTSKRDFSGRRLDSPHRYRASTETVPLLNSGGGTNSVLLPSQVFTVAIRQSYGKDINFVSTRPWHRQHCVCGVFWFGHWTFLNVNVLSRRQGRARSPWHTLDLISHFTLGLLILVEDYIYMLISVRFIGTYVLFVWSFR